MERAKKLTTENIIIEINNLNHKWDRMVSDPEFEGHGGSPFEWVDERLQELEYELKRRNNGPKPKDFI
jgi:hypothetical protein